MQKMVKGWDDLSQPFTFILRSLYLDFPNQYLGLNGDFCELGPVDFFLGLREIEEGHGEELRSSGVKLLVRLTVSDERIWQWSSKCSKISWLE